MKNIIYLITIGMLILVSFLALLFYYTQDFKEELNFIDSIDYKDINFQTNQRDSITYLSSAYAKIGELNLQNNGYFTQRYYLPQLFGCIILKENNTEKRIKFEVQFNEEMDKEGQYSYRYNNEINVPVGETKFFWIKGFYSDWSTPFSTFSKDNIKGFEVYKIPKKESNPLGENYYNKNYYDCYNLQDLKPIAKIKIK